MDNAPKVTRPEASAAARLLASLVPRSACVKGGKARAVQLAPERRARIARMGGLAGSWKLTKEQRVERARKAGKARQAKARAARAAAALGDVSVFRPGADPSASS